MGLTALKLIFSDLYEPSFSGLVGVPGLSTSICNVTMKMIPFAKNNYLRTSVYTNLWFFYYSVYFKLFVPF